MAIAGSELKHQARAWLTTTGVGDRHFKIQNELSGKFKTSFSSRELVSSRPLPGFK